MCIACELDFTWLDYLDSRSLVAPDKRAPEQGPFARFAELQPAPAKPQSAPASADKSKFFCDDPTAG